MMIVVTRRLVLLTNNLSMIFLLIHYLVIYVPGNVMLSINQFFYKTTYKTQFLKLTLFYCSDGKAANPFANPCITT